jgi:hypothetical protein
MLKTKINHLTKLLVLVFFLMGSVATAQTHKVEKDGKVKNKKSHSSDHNQKHESKKKHHQTDIKTHIRKEEGGFGKKKRKKK